MRKYRHLKITSFIFFLMISVLPLNIFAEIDPDSLLININNLDNKEKIKIYLQLENHYYVNRDSLTIRYYKKVRDLSQKIDDDESYIASKEILANYYFRLALYSKTIEFLKPVIEYKRFNHKNHIFENYSKIIESYYRIGIYNEALKYYFAGQQFAEPKDRFSEAKIKYIVGDIYLRKENYNESKKYFASALKIFQSLKRKKEIAKSCDRLAEISAIEKKYDKAILYAKKSLKIYKSLINKQEIGLAQLKLSEYYLNSNKIILSEKHLLEAKEMFIKVNNNHDLAVLYEKSGELYFAKHEFDKSERYIRKSLKILEHLVNNSVKIQDMTMLTRIKIYKNQVLIADSMMDDVFSLIEKDNKTKVNLKIKEESRKLSLFDKTLELNAAQEKILHINTELKRVKILIIFGSILFVIITFFVVLSVKRIKYSRKLFSELQEKTALLESKEALNEKYSEEKIHLETKNIILKMVFDANEDFNIPLKDMTENLNLIKASQLCPDEKIKKRLSKIEASIKRIKDILDEMSDLKKIETEKYLDTHHEKMISFKNNREDDIR